MCTSARRPPRSRKLSRIFGLRWTGVCHGSSRIRHSEMRSSHPWISAPEQHTEEILDDPEYLSSMVVYLHALGREIPPAVVILTGCPQRQEFRLATVATVCLIASVFEQGGITVLIGTKSLLGEGWDAPCINTLVLASFVGSFMLSNQMRGRAIRVDSAQPQKTANIWHLVCAEPGIFGPGDDYELLARRCSAFVGVSATAPVIENGTERLGFGHPPFSLEELDQINAQTRSRALDREGLRKQWHDALDAGSIKQMTDGLKAPEESLPRGFVLANTIAALLFQSLYVFVAVLESLGRALGRARITQDFWSLVLTVVGIAAVV